MNNPRNTEQDIAKVEIIQKHLALAKELKLPEPRPGTINIICATRYAKLTDCKNYDTVSGEKLNLVMLRYICHDCWMKEYRVLGLGVFLSVYKLSEKKKETIYDRMRAEGIQGPIIDEPITIPTSIRKPNDVNS